MAGELYYYGVNPIDVLNRACAAYWAHMWTAIVSAEMIPVVEQGHKAILLAFINDIGLEENFYFVCLGMEPEDTIPGGYGVPQGAWDLYLGNPGEPADLPSVGPALIAEGWALVTEGRYAVLQSWISGVWSTGDQYEQTIPDTPIFTIDSPMSVTSAIGTTQIQTKLYWLMFGIISESANENVFGMAPAGVERASAVVYTALGMDGLVRAVQDIAHRTTVAQINNRGAIADLGSGDIVTPEDVPE